MSDSIIVSGSKYGSTRRYAEELGKMTDWDVVDYCHVKHLNSGSSDFSSDTTVM